MTLQGIKEQSGKKKKKTAILNTLLSNFKWFFLGARALTQLAAGYQAADGSAADGDQLPGHLAASAERVGSAWVSVVCIQLLYIDFPACVRKYSAFRILRKLDQLGCVVCIQVLCIGIKALRK